MRGHAPIHCQILNSSFHYGHDRVEKKNLWPVPLERLGRDSDRWKVEIPRNRMQRSKLPYSRPVPVAAQPQWTQLPSY